MIVQLQKDVVQGPVDHPRFGRSLIVRPTVEGSRANRFPTQAIVITAVARKMIELTRLGEKIQAVVVEGEGQDPTRHPEFHEISENLRELLDKHFPKADLVLVSNQPNLDRASVRHALTLFDRTVVRLEAGFQKTFAALTGGDPKDFKDMVEQMGRLGKDRLIVQATFVQGEIDNSSDNEIKAWIKHLTEIKPARVHITTRAKPKGKKERPISKARMTQIAELVTTKTGIPVEVGAD
jgi:wyosine [tRNA(Phe)-imidazoG37] synthetase (radical SAM superfamily)